MARPADTYRAARRNRARKAKLVWQLGRERSGWYCWHASMPQRNGVPIPAKEAA